ncbi:molybdenum cofactor guanylyltransferase MobA [Methylocella sp.]|uniref:molybdenum cofactor guanylyltransferase MobA n=1 Tax=Methylocella sp. TaxID=1978226 RepID=UPI0035B1DB85
MVEILSAPVGVVLAGGLASRLGGGDKALQEIGGTSILSRVIEALSPQCAGTILNANGDPARFGSFGLPVVADGRAESLGPLAGILAGLDWIAAERPGVEDALFAPGDAPFLPCDLAARLAAARREAGAEIACARSGGRTHHVVALWPVSSRSDLRAALDGEGLRGVGAFLARRLCAFAEWPAEPLDPFFNVNAPEDLRRAREIAERRG